MSCIGVAALHLAPAFSTVAAQELPEHATPVRSPPVLFIRRRKSQLLIAGDASSSAHEARMLQLAASFLPATEVKNELRLRTALPAGWSPVTELVLRAIAETHTATAYVDEQQIFIRGFTSDLAAWQTASERLEKSLLPGMRFRHEMDELHIGASLEQQCRRLFESVSSSRHIGFAHASDHLSSNAFSLLDELVQIAADCPSAAITVTGNTDNSGNEPGNLQLSKARADSVIAYMVARGIAADRLQSHGAGSSAPLATEDSARARELNRRIDFEIFFPEQPD
jgi:OOP family OmpA-OmpF porin